MGQFIEGNILTPKLVGKSVGLHPVWLLFALSVFGSLFGNVLEEPLASAVTYSGAPASAAQSPDALHALSPEAAAPIVARLAGS